MAEAANITPLGEIRPFDPADVRDTMIRVDDVSMVFNMASEQLNNLKEYAIALMRRELMFKEFRALDGVSLEVKKGDVYGILGTNGSGKSTLLKIVAGVLEPTEGSVQIHGNIAPLIELGAGFDMELTARENIYLNGSLLGYPKKFIAQHFDEIVEFAEVEQFLDMPLKNYSSGMVARIAFAIATVIVPDILIVDEVLSVGDFMFQQKCERRIQSLIKDHGVTVLIVSHNNDQIERLCNKAIWIEKGHTRMIGSAREVCEVYRLLGGHIGTPEAEARVFEMLQDTTPADESIIKTIAGEDRFSTALELFEEASDVANSNTLVIAPGHDAPSCMAANALASAFGCGVLLVAADAVPDVVAHVLKHHAFTDIYIVGAGTLVMSETVDAINALSHAQIHPVSAGTPADTSLAIHQTAVGAWGRTAILSADDRFTDILTLMPYLYRNRCPVFFRSEMEENSPTDQRIIELLTSDAFDRVIYLGSPDDNIEAALQRCDKDMVCFDSAEPIEANRIINAWLSANCGTTPTDLIISSFWSPPSAFALGPFAGTRASMVLLEEPQDLESVANAFGFVMEYGKTIERLTFLGGEMRFSDQDKLFLSKALAKAHLR